MLWASMRAEYHFTDEEFLDAEPSRINALNAAACERAGMQGLNTYRNKDILAHGQELKAQGQTLELKDGKWQVAN